VGLYKEISDYALRLKSAAKWYSSGQAVDHVFHRGKDDESDYVYEFYVLMTLLANLSINYVLGYQSDPKGLHVFPKGHSKKNNYPFFKAYSSLNNLELKFQICPGSQVLNKYHHHVHPDISFQKPSAGMTPTGKDIILVVDSKHKKRPDSRVTTDDVKVFAKDLEDFEVESSSYEVKFAPPLDVIDKSAIITNGKPHMDSDAMLADLGFVVLFNFYPGKNAEIIR
jgi:hypothetical protein